MNSHIHLQWLTPDEGGRKTPFCGGRYTPTARFSGDEEPFSVILEFPKDDAANPTNGTLRLLFADLVDIQRRILPGAALEIMEGPRVVARCEIEALAMANVASRD